MDGSCIRPEWAHGLVHRPAMTARSAVARVAALDRASRTYRRGGGVIRSPFISRISGRWRTRGSRRVRGFGGLKTPENSLPSPTTLRPNYGRVFLRVRLRIVSMGDSAEQEASHGDMDHGLGDIETLLVVAHETAPPCEPGEVRSTTQRRGRTLKPGSVSMRRTTS